ncbi:LuxR C-terminal-related transcriptional regulator [Actinoallomurus sp. NPDC052308]|uniref:LuxR C-terminal-related transcriptional regulator n=1 Tax=Actinoallomurus sp. NPDC052308 TaxID=3155530 RepID=UPI0034494FD4
MVRWGQDVVVVGRRAELAVVAELFRAEPAGAAGLLIEGAAGIGKSTLWQAGVAAARERGHRVLGCRPAEAEAQLSFTAIADLVDPVLGDALPGLPGPQRRALELALLRAESEEPADERAVAFGLLSVMRAVARSGPVLIAVDDWQWLDTPSARMLGFVLRRLDEEPVRLLATIRAGAGAGVAAGLERDLGEGRLTRLELRPLGLAALHRLALTRAGLALPRRTLMKIQSAAAGNMVFALEIVRALASRAGSLPPGEALPVPATLNELVVRRVARLPAATRDALLAAAALTRPTTRLLRAVDRRRFPAEVLGAAENAELVVLEGDRVRFSHPLIAAAVYAEAGPEERRRLHRRLARVVPEPEERARHLALAAEGPSREVADALDAAARTARTRGAPDAAAELYELAAEATPPDQRAAWRRRQADAAEQHFVGGDRRRAGELLERVLSGCPPGRERARVLRLLGEVRYHDDSFPEAGRLLRLALAEAGADAAERAAVNTGLAYVAHAVERMPMAAEYVRAAVAAAEEYGRPGLLAEVLASATMVEFLLGHGLDERRLDRALAIEDITRRTPAPMRPSAIHGALMSWIGRPEAARESLEGVRSRLLELGDEAALPFLAFLLAPAACSRGDLAAAVRHGEEGLEAAARVGTDVLMAHALTAMAFADAYTGRTRSALDRAGRAASLFTQAGCRGWVSWPLAVLGFAYLSLDDAPAAVEALRPVLELLPLAGVQEPAAIPFVPEAVQALIAIGEPDTAEPVLAWFEKRGRDLDRPWALATGLRCRALLRAARGDPRGALESLTEALKHHERLEHPVERARTLFVLGQLQRRTNQRRRAKETLERARAVFDEVGAAQWSRRAAAELARLGLRRSGGPELTPRERQVAENAAAGATNNQIASALYISPKTVEANLARVYRKLGIASRAELGAWMVAERRAEEPGT